MAQKIFLGIVGPQVTLYGQTARPQPPLGLCYIFNSVTRAGWDPVLLDGLAEGYTHFSEDKETGIRITGLDNKEVIDRISRIKPDMIGINLGISTDHDYSKKLIEEIRKNYEGKIVLGGSEASLMHKEILSGLPIEKIPGDFIITGRDIGSGEESVYKLLKAVDGDRNYCNVPGICFLENGKVIITPSVKVTEQSLANLSLPMRDLLATKNEIDIYSFINQSHTGPVDFIPYSTMHTSRGCGGGCLFCHTQYNFDRTLIRRSLENIFFELEDLKSRGVQTVSIEDDNFGGFTLEQTALAVNILEKIGDMNFKGIYFPNGMTIKSMINNDHSILRQLKKMADRGIKVRNSLPAESGDEETLKGLIHKPHNIEDIQLVLKELKDGYLTHENIEIDSFFMVGVVGYNNRKESRGSIRKTFDLADKVSDSGMRVNIWWMKPNPNGPQYKLWREKFPEMPFYKLQFSFVPGIWGSEEEELEINEQIRMKNFQMNKKGTGSKRPIFPVD